MIVLKPMTFRFGYAMKVELDDIWDVTKIAASQK